MKRIIAQLTLLLSSIAGILESQAMKHDFFPLQVGRRWVYEYSMSETYYENLSPSTINIGTGLVNFEVISADDRDTLLLWIIIERDSVFHSVENTYSPDTTYTVITLDTLALYEYKHGDHPMRFRSRASIFTISDDQPQLTRYDTSLADRFAGHGPIYSQGFVHWDSIWVRANVGAISTSYAFSHGPNTPYGYGANSNLLYTVVSVPEQLGPTTPVDFQVSCFPNPFNERTNISLSIGVRTFGSLAIFDLLGRRIVELASRDFDPGYYQYSWEPRAVSSSVYLCVFQTSDFRRVFRLIHAK